MGRVSGPFLNFMEELALCERFHCLPSQLDEEKAVTITRMRALGQAQADISWRQQERATLQAQLDQMKGGR